MKPPVMVTADQQRVPQVRSTATRPRVLVVGIAPGRRDVAPVDLTSRMPCPKRLALARAEETLAAPEVEGLRPSTEHDRDDLGGARQPPRLGRTDPLLGVQPTDRGRTEFGTQIYQPDRDHHRGRVASVTRQGVRIDVLEQVAERATRQLVGSSTLTLRLAWLGVRL